MQETAAESTPPDQLPKQQVSLSEAPPLSAPNIAESTAAVQSHQPEVTAAQAVAEPVEEAMPQTAQPSDMPAGIAEPTVTQTAQVKLARREVTRRNALSGSRTRPLSLQFCNTSQNQKIEGVKLESKMVFCKSGEHLKVTDKIVSAVAGCRIAGGSCNCTRDKLVFSSSGHTASCVHGFCDSCNDSSQAA